MCISWIIKCLIIIDARCKHEESSCQLEVALTAVVIAVQTGRLNETAVATQTAYISFAKRLDFGLNYFTVQNNTHDNTTLCFPVNVFLWNTVLLYISKEY